MNEKLKVLKEFRKELEEIFEEKDVETIRIDMEKSDFTEEIVVDISLYISDYEGVRYLKEKYIEKLKELFDAKSYKMRPYVIEGFPEFQVIFMLK